MIASPATSSFAPPVPAAAVQAARQRAVPLLPFGTIKLARGIGRGPTERAAFDAALLEAGIANQNLIPLSAPIPPGSQIERGRYLAHPQTFGQRLYVVMARRCESQRGRTAHAGLGWVREQVGGQGLMVDMQGDDADRVSRELHATLLAMQRARGVSFGPVSTELAQVVCEGEPVCALVVAVFQSEPW